jgi:hypothetical protein
LTDWTTEHGRRSPQRGRRPFHGETCKPAASEDASANDAAAQDAAMRSRMEMNDDA